ncbi:DUF1642 domain-containing protein [Lactococcus garvieae]|uniref:DUF1642 domain-containing protein n=1 Tax=Lactococcus garvieae TaxID=1363 RepID=UPI003D77A831
MSDFEKKLRTLKEKTFIFDWSPGIRFWYDLSSLVNTFEDWISPEDHQAEIAKLNSKIDWLHGLLDERNEEVLQTVKRLNEAQPEIPEFVAKDIEEFRKHIETVGLLYYEDFMSHETLDWIIDIRNQAAFMQALSTGKYTVAKEKRFYLKNKLTGNFLMKWGDALSEDTVFTLQEESNKGQFTQQEIDSMETGSYEQIEVEE